MTIAEHGTYTTWSRVAKGLHVANRDGSFLGFVEKRPDGRFSAFDAHSELMGDYADRDHAMATVAAQATRS